MSPLLLFGLLLLVTFGVLVVVWRPSRTEADVARHLLDIQGGAPAGSESAHSTIMKKEPFSSIPALDEWLRGIPAATRLHLLISQAGLHWSIASVVLTSLVAATATALLISLYVPVATIVLLMAVGVGAIPYAFLLGKRAARFRRFETNLPEAIDLMSRALKSGHSIGSMIEMVAEESPEPISSEFRLVFEEQNLGLPIREAMENLVDRMPLEDVHFLVVAILVQKETGGNLAEILDKAAFIMRERMRLKGQLRVYTAQGRMSGWVLCLLPFILAFLLSLVNPVYEKQLWTTPMGQHFMYAGLILMAIGIFVVRSIVSIKV